MSLIDLVMLVGGRLYCSHYCWEEEEEEEEEKGGRKRREGGREGRVRTKRLKLHAQFLCQEMKQRNLIH